MNLPTTLTFPLGRLAQVSIALWLLPAVLFVLAIGAVGAVVLEASRRFRGGVLLQGCNVEDAPGLELFRS